MQFVDKCKINLKAGNGGDGMIAWRREAHVEFGGPAGGDGGNGGDIYLLADHNETTLFNLRYIKQINAENGVNGQSENKTGARGNDKIIKVPVGTIVYDQNNTLIIDMNKDKQLFLICKGGKGGLGNASFKSNYNREPNLYERGELGEEKLVTFELKEIADIGLIGLPNAGKSTFIKTVCNVDVKIGDYPFTTVHPVLGTYFWNKEKIIFCDIPGLIEGAAQGKGLGHEFLKHVERCKILLHLVSGDENDNPDIIEAYETIIKELKDYQHNLQDKKIFTIVTKSDIADANIQYKKLQDYLKNENVYFISCETGDNVQEVTKIIINEFLHLVKNEETIENINDEEVKFLINQTKKTKQDEITLENLNENNLKHNNERKFLDINDEKLDIYRDDNGNIHIKHPILQYWAHRIPHDTRDNILRFNQKMHTLKLNDVLKKHQLQKDETVIIDDNEIEWIID